MIQFPASPEITEVDLPKAHNFATFHPFIKGVFSQWHPTPFEVEERQYSCAEQYMMLAKAALFEDFEMARKIAASDDPAVQKRLGASVSNFDGEVWHRWRVHIVYTANRAKFAQNRGAMRQLKNTTPAMLVEANPRDWNWGNGLHIDDPANQKPKEWKGTNLLGRVLTLIREQGAIQT
ncbi:MAG: NADAR family protein [Erythrobacter sp.]|uniref:NADAR family protein n=1 Tax=Erythrobacter sp. TaxID=1042 RepID=UPI0032988A44